MGAGKNDYHPFSNRAVVPPEAESDAVSVARINGSRTMDVFEFRVPAISAPSPRPPRASRSLETFERTVQASRQKSGETKRRRRGKPIEISPEEDLWSLADLRGYLAGRGMRD